MNVSPTPWQSAMIDYKYDKINSYKKVELSYLYCTYIANLFITQHKSQKQLLSACTWQESQLVLFSHGCVYVNQNICFQKIMLKNFNYQG